MSKASWDIETQEYSEELIEMYHLPQFFAHRFRNICDGPLKSQTSTLPAELAVRITVEP